MLEGVEGAGKSTQAARLSRWLDGRGVAHVTAREPGGTAVGEAIRGVVLDRLDLDIPPVSELYLLLAARAAFVRDVVRPALERGEWVVADRYDLSTLAYQAYGRGLPIEEVRRANALATGGLRPDLYIVLDVPVGVGMGRKNATGSPPDRMESERGGFLERVRDGYRALAEAEDRARLVPADGTPDAVFQAMTELLKDLETGTDTR